MRGRKQRTGTSTPEPVRGELEEVDEKNGFFACYLLCSLCPRYKGHTYIGFTVNPRRRIRQHNGEIRCGAWRTKCKRPWEMVLCIYGFPSNVSALQFEWAWQHPKESLAVRKAAASFRSLSGIENKIKLAYTMLTLPQWEILNITVNFFSTKYVRHSAHCPKLPKHMKMSVQAMDELPCYMDNNVSNDDDVGDDDDDDRDKDGFPCYEDISTSIGTSAICPFENGYQRSRELYGSLHEGGSMDEVNRTSRIQSVAISHSDDLFIREADNLKQQVDTLNVSHLIVSPLHNNKEKLPPSSKVLFPCSKELFECVKTSNLTQWKQLSNSRTISSGASCDNAPQSPECSVIDLSTPSSCVARSVKRHSPLCVEIIDLIDSPT